ncbi:hypothetical protein [Geotalea toluenoxydans]|nr:hypothetical protein [Geotalea toluenoxydans]
MKANALLATAIIALSFTGTAYAVGEDKVVEFTGSERGGGLQRTGP